MRRLQEAVWDPDVSLLATAPALLPVNRELPPTLNLRIVSRVTGSPVFAAAGNSLLSLRHHLEAAPRAPERLIVELVPDHLSALLQLDRWIAAERPATRVLVVGPATAGWGAYLVEHARAIDVAPSGNSVTQLTGVTTDAAGAWLSPSIAELAQHPLWEKRRYAVGYGCPAACALCPRKNDLGTAGRLPEPGALLDQIEARVERYGVRDVEILGTAWAGEPDWAETLLVERIRRGLEIRLRVVVTVDQLRETLVELLVPGGCRHLTVRAGVHASEIAPGVTRRLKELEGWGRIVLLASVAALGEPAALAASRIAAFERAVRAAVVHVLFHGDLDQPVACTELGRIVDGAETLAFHLGVTQRSDSRVLAWSHELREALANLPGQE